MPRGRPPIRRTKEEALTARRDQIRKNVQAFRQRKQSQRGPEESRSGAEEKNLTFVLEDLGQFNGQDRGEKDVSGKKELRCETERYSNDRALSNLIEKTCEEPFSGSPSSDIKGSDCLVLPLEINAAQSSRQQLASNAMSAFLPKPHDTSAQPLSTGPHWCQIIPDCVNRNAILDFAIQALCLIQVSHVSQDRWLLQRSLSYYDKALKGLQRSLTKSRDGFQAEIFAATMVLATYELLQGTNAQGRGWMFHIEGATTYLNMFPSLDVHTFSHQLSFHFLETICIFDALGARKPSCFSDSKWWKDSVDQFAGEAYGALLRMITSLPSVLQQCDAANGLSPSKETSGTWLKLLRLSLRMEDAFLEWFQRTTDDEGFDFQYDDNRPWTRFPSTILDYSPLQISARGISFQTLDAARLFLLYWSSMILLNEAIISLLHKIDSYPLSATSQPFFATHPSDDRTISPTKYTTSSHAFALRILHSSSFCLRLSHGIIGKSLLLLPLWLARNHLREAGDEDQSSECNSILEKLGQKEMRFGLRVKKGL